MATEEKSVAVECVHCGEPVPTELQSADSPSFCCAGCKVAYAILQDAAGSELFSGLEEGGTSGKSSNQYEEMDHSHFIEHYAQQYQQNLKRIRFYLEGIHCAACVLVIEKIPQYVNGVLHARTNMTTSIVELVWNPAVVPLSEIARTLDRLGYKPHPVTGKSQNEVFQQENRTQLIRLAVAGACAANVMLISLALYAGMFSGMEWEHSQLFRYTSALIAMISMAWPGRVFLRGAWSALKTQTPHMDLPIALGISVGGIAGVINTLRGSGEIYFDSLTVLIFLLLVGRYVQFRQQHLAFNRVSLLRSITPRIARLLEEGQSSVIPVEALKVGDHIELRPGDVLPADGLVVSGSSSIDESIVTGESRGVPVEPGATVIAGTTNLTSRLEVRVTEIGTETRIGKMMDLAELGARNKQPLIELANRMSGHFIKVVLLLSLVCVGIWWSSAPEIALQNGIALLIVACPCALGLATPLAIAVAQGKAAKKAFLIKSGDVFERLSQPGTIWFDKTGTLTTGKMTVSDWWGDQTLYASVAAVQEQVNHPIARAMVHYLQEKIPDGSSSETKVIDLHSFPGRGLKGNVNGTLLIIGNEKLMCESGVVLTDAISERLSEYHHQGKTAVLIAVEGSLKAICALGDELTLEAIDSVKQLQAKGWETGILSGDHQSVVSHIAKQAGIKPENAYGGVTPEEKLQFIQSQPQDQTTVMVGDGVNDSAALAAADVGIAVHGGAEASLQAAPVYLSQPNLALIPQLIQGAEKTTSVIKRNLIVSLGYNVIAASLALGGLINPLIAAILMPLSSLSVLVLSFMNRSFKENLS